MRLNADVQGLGPLFKLRLKIQNTGRQALEHSAVTFGFDHSLCVVSFREGTANATSCRLVCFHGGGTDENVGDRLRARASCTIFARATLALHSVAAGRYALKRPLFPLPFLTPGVSYEYEVTVQSVHPAGAAGIIRVFVSDGTTGTAAAPLISAIINMPMSEIME